MTTAPERKLQALVAFVAGLSAAAALAGLWLHWAGAVWLTPLIPIVSTWAWRQARVEPRSLRWDGQCWRLSPMDVPVELEVLADLQSWLLLRADGRIYLPFSQRSQSARWSALRATLYTARPRNPET